MKLSVSKRSKETIQCDSANKLYFIKFYSRNTRGYWELKGEALDLNLRRTRFGKGYGPVVRENTKLSKWIHKMKKIS
jgi:hypothetical protein